MIYEWQVTLTGKRRFSSINQLVQYDNDLSFGELELLVTLPHALFTSLVGVFSF
ncbi:hypothetical protein HMPREF9695_00407 [Afipia broomeae ATCC 49717]|uniref:Uncharacterized protein n=1 Tax=Afipia broomeae ATCC 49717 TaxID=883078 RepID=K8PP92_9BRAD|nr:hypothetical protein HMPREF9695_00407 [Afipia broomeae ATCC 49717]